jgi:hypothetical protein
MKTLISLLVAGSLFSAGAEAGTFSTSVNVSGQLLAVCGLTTAPISFGAITLLPGNSATTNSIWELECTGPVSVTIYPDMMASPEWNVNSGAARNIGASGSSAINLSMTVDGSPLPITGRTIFNAGVKQFITISATITPTGMYVGTFSKDLYPNIVFN